MQYPITDRAALTLSREFYRSLVSGDPLDTAISQARKAVYGLTDSLEWATPVLFSRSPDNRLIELPEGDARPIIPRQPFEPETVVIPAGCYQIGDGSDNPVELPTFRMGRYPVTNREYAKFLAHTPAQDVPPRQGWFSREPSEDREGHPVASVNWAEACAYCEWLSSETGRAYRLPTEAEWEAGAHSTGPDGVASKTVYPWGNEWDGERADVRANIDSDDTTPVTAHPAGESGFGVADLLGNVQEWTLTRWGADRDSPAFPPPYRLGDGRDDTDTPTQRDLRVHRGGSFRSSRDELTVFARGVTPPTSRIPWRGFRVVMVVLQ
jgi:formylglycine-generating enzyme required for sulfatase activity